VGGGRDLGQRDAEILARRGAHLASLIHLRRSDAWGCTILLDNFKVTHKLTYRGLFVG